MTWSLVAGAVVLIAVVGLLLLVRIRRRRSPVWSEDAYEQIPLIVEIPHYAGTPGQRPRPLSRLAEALEDPPKGSGMVAAPEAPVLVEGKTISFYRAGSATLKLLPGRLEVIAGEEHREDIRFVRVPGAPAEVTFGRSEGPPMRHIQFRVGTVSRQHARMVYADSRWTLTNLSSTNPVVVNGVELLPPTDQHVLSQGDRIEMGEIVFRFHSH